MNVVTLTVADDRLGDVLGGLAGKTETIEVRRLDPAPEARPRRTAPQAIREFIGVGVKTREEIVAHLSALDWTTGTAIVTVNRMIREGGLSRSGDGYRVEG
jgi:hypothetical protein